jgi:hypothetical protein
MRCVVRAHDLMLPYRGPGGLLWSECRRCGRQVPGAHVQEQNGHYAKLLVRWEEARAWLGRRWLLTEGRDVIQSGGTELEVRIR